MHWVRPRSGHGFSPRPTPYLIATYPIADGGHAWSVGRALDRERAVDEVLHVLQGPGGPERSGLVDDADLDGELVIAKEIPHLREPVIHGKDRLPARGREGLEDVDDLRLVDEGDEGFRSSQCEGTKALAETPGDDHGLHLLSEAGPRLSNFCPSGSFGDDRDDVVSPEDDGPDPADVVFLRLLRILEDHVHVIVVSDELPLEDAIVLQ